MTTFSSQGVHLPWNVAEVEVDKDTSQETDIVTENVIAKVFTLLRSTNMVNLLILDARDA